MLREKGFQFANVTHEIKESPGGPKLVHLTFNMDEGPKVKIRKIDFVGNKAISDGTLKRQMKENKERGPFQDFIHFPTWFLTIIGDRGTYQETKFDEDAEKIRRLLPRPRLPPRERRRARAQGARATPTTRRRAGSSCGFRSPRGRATRSAPSTSPATPSSRPSS